MVTIKNRITQVISAIALFAGFVLLTLVVTNGADPCAGNNRCVVKTDPFCGNGACDDDETETNCPSDCLSDIEAEPVPRICGDGVCDSGETTENCLRDCSGGDCGAVCRKEGYLYTLSECSSVNVLAKFNISTRVTCCCANENRINTCGNGVCQENLQENESNCPVDCQATDNSCAGENEAISGRNCCPGLEPKCGAVPMTLADGTTKMSLTGCWCIPKIASVCGNGVCSSDEDGYACPQDCPRISRDYDGYEKGCVGETDCGICQSCMGGNCVDISTEWGDGLYGCPAGVVPNLSRCYRGECTTCSGTVIYDGTAKKYGCWYVADPATNCEDFCGQKGCISDPVSGGHWGDDENCTIGKQMTGCRECSSDYEDGWRVPYYNIAKDTCYHYQGAGVYYSCYWGPEMANIRRICACNY